jgi:REP element-mobilizing transposase RayT
MPNHVHLLVAGAMAAEKWLRMLKGATARQANLLLGRTGKPFWQGESYDHLVRSDEEFGRIQSYIENNPVKAGLTAAPEEFPWSSAGAFSKQAPNEVLPTSPPLARGPKSPRSGNLFH